jgi:hypothetical protein
VGPAFLTRYNRLMRCTALIVLILATVAIAQNAPKPAPRPEPKSVTVPFTLDHNRIIIEVSVPLSDGTMQSTRAWIDNGNPELRLSQRLAKAMGLTLACAAQECGTRTPLPDILIGGMTLPLAQLSPTHPGTVSAAFPGLRAEIDIPSRLLRNYDVLIDFPEHELTIAQPGTLKFNGVAAKVSVNPANGLIQVPSQIANKKYNLGLDLGSSISFLTADLFDKLSPAHSDWPHMIGAIGPANMWGSRDEPNWKLMRLDRVQYGPLYLTDVPFVSLDAAEQASFGRRWASPTVGLLGSEALLNYRVGIDYAHSTIYFDIGRMFNAPDFDVIGLILRPEDDGRFTILGIADFEGKPSVPAGADGVQPGDHLVVIDNIPVAGASMGQVWSRLAGEPGKEHTLTVERNGKQFTVVAKVQHFLGATNEDGGKKESRK